MRALRWGRLLVLLAVFGVWFAALGAWRYRQDVATTRAAAYETLLIDRQTAYEQWLAVHERPVFGPWQQVGPFQNILSIRHEPERNPSATAQYGTRWGTVGWQTMPQYVDGYITPIRLSEFAREAIATKPTICLGRTIQATSATNVSTFVGADGGFSVSLNGEPLLLNDKHGDIQPGEERLWLPLQAGENRLVIKLEINRVPCRFFFQPDFGEPLTDELLAELDRRFPIEQPRATGYRELARVSATDAEDAYYRLTEFPVPDDILLEGGGLGFLPDGRLAVGTRRGFVYLVEGATNLEPGQVQFSEYASGLHEALGLHTSDNGEMFVVQRGELTQLLDRDGDGQADTFRSLCNDWGLTGEYQEYTLDLERDPAGNFFTALCLSDEERRGVSTSNVPWRGWIVQITPNGELVPWCCGLRCCNGLCWNSQGDLFATDNQGQWVPATPVYHIRKGHYYGSPPSRKWVERTGSEEARRRTERPPTPPAVWIPYEEFCMSAADIACDLTDGKFGPFREQLFVADMMKGTIVRVALEKVNGEYQGACFLFRRGVGAVNRMTFGPDDRLYLARASRGWAGAGQGDGLARLEFTGRTPFEVETVHLLRDAFAIRFTLPLAADAVERTAAITIEQFRYEYWEEYGSPKIDRELLPVRELAVSPDGLMLTIRVDGQQAGRVCHLSLPRLQSATGETLLHTDAFYTINSLDSGDEVAQQP